MSQSPRVFYQIFVRSFCDSNRDGIGDLRGIISKLDYLEELGVEGLWLSPIFKSPSYHKYDITNYWEIDPEYGTLKDLKDLCQESHKRGIIVILDFVLNHTSDQHTWFQESKKGKDNPYRNYYLWKTPKEIKELGIATRKETADSQEKNPWHWAKRGDTEKYYGMFWSKMPDLNLDHPPLRKELYDIGKYWLAQGVDGFRMDAAKHVYPEYEIEKAHQFWQEFKHEMEAAKANFFLVGEVWSDVAIIAPFYKGLKANFNFELSYAFQDIAQGKKPKKPILDLLLDGYEVFEKVNPRFVDATMLSNHDMNRIATTARGSMPKLKMLANLLLTLPGLPFIYYGEELGMKGKKPDENIREAFLWNTRWEDKDRTNWRKPRYNTDSKVSPLAIQRHDHNSLFNHYKSLIQLRKKHAALWQVYQPNLTKLHSSSDGVIAFCRPHHEGDIYVYQNVTAEQVPVIVIEGEYLWGQKRNWLPPYEMVVVKVS